MAVTRAAVILAIAGCLGVGIYGTHINGAKNGFFAALGRCAGRGTSPETFYFPGGPEPFTWTYTGVPAIDGQLRVLVAFFTAVLDGEKSWDVVASYWSLMFQFAAGWTLLSIEGLREGNRGRVVSWIGTMGVVVQNAAYTVAAPVYLITHLLTSPTASSSSLKASSLVIDPTAAKILPTCALLAFFVPGIAMTLPSPSVLSPSAHYGWIAAWQAFPIWQALLLFVLRPVLAPLFKFSSHTDWRKTTRSAYQFALELSVVGHLGLLAVAVTPPTVVPSSGWAAPWLSTMLKEVDFSRAFVPTSLTDPPSVMEELGKLVDRVPAGWLAPLAKHFLQWDVYSANAAVLIWAAFLYSRAAGLSTARTSPGTVFIKACGWFVVGGPTAAAAILLRERDDAVVENEVGKGKKV
ncbi:hypothetical protein B0H66DRAFT_558219 [Apodospora peruviana]|uniref:Uncharacterized protein n=1 Tax=Apodospora peruviana TaxID=516989 RepID=A0AAE0I581_9PEZI|nr:hypothetical protein B0H66DRAFT_558219 [Apodospora peruviana]